MLVFQCLTGPQTRAGLYRSGPTRRDRYAIRGSGTPWQCRVGREFAGIVRSIAAGLLQRVSKARGRLR
jgi:hypothetical protein